MSFADIIGHDVPVRILKQVLERRSVAHAYLFSGPEGIGKKMAAFAFAAAVNCPSAGPGGGCGACPSCRKVAARSHPDVRVLEADGEEIKIDQVREMQAALALRPFEAETKVLIVDGAETMKDAAANALLKTLEEPPGDAVIMLVTARPQGLLPTIRSRCQQIRFLPLPRQVLARAMSGQRGLSDADAWFLAALAQGSIGRGLEMDVEDERTARDEFLSLIADLRSMNEHELLLHADAAAKDRDGLERLLDIGIERFRDMAVYHETGDERLLVYPQPGIVGPGPRGRDAVRGLLPALDLCIKSRSLLGRRVSGQLVAENLFLSLGGSEEFGAGPAAGEGGRPR